MKESFQDRNEVDAVKDQLASLMKSGLSGDLAAQSKTLDASLAKTAGVTLVGSGGGGGGFGRVSRDRRRCNRSWN